MASTKAALKAAKAALDSQDYDKAITEARKVLDADKNNFHANVFLGLALDKQEKNEESEKAYQSAASIKPDDALAWQGLVTLHEKAGNKQLDAYADAACRLAQVYATAEDRHRCQTVVDKYLAFAKAHGTRLQQRQALDFIVPGSPVYDCLEGRVPRPDHTYARIVELVEADEKEKINKLIAERRTRLGAKIGQVTLEVKREVWASSDLESLYQGIIDYSHDDETRRLYEEKLLQRAYEVLTVLPAQEKVAKREQVQKLAEGMTIIKVPFELAWRVVIEWNDVEDMASWDVSALRQYIELLPEDGLGKVLRGFLRSDISPFPQVSKEVDQKEARKNDRKRGKKGKSDSDDDEEEDDAKDEDKTETEEDENHKADSASLDPDSRLYLMTEGLEESSRSSTSQRIMAEYYLHLEEWASAVEAARKAYELIGQERRALGLLLTNKRDGASLALATALIHHQTPRHHAESRRIFEDVLARKPGNVAALIGIGLILEEEEDYAAAADFLTKAQEKHPTIKIRSEAAWCHALADGESKEGKEEEYAGPLEELQECLAELESQDRSRKHRRDKGIAPTAQELINKPLEAELLYRIGYCLWRQDTSRAWRKNRQPDGPYSHFLRCLQLDINYAPAYTALGIFYADYARDRSRSRKCFQKAFELSASEVYAAERLARAFADVADWDLVAIVAQRVVDSGRVRPPPGSKRKAIAWPHAALGTCALNAQEHDKAVPAFNAALRIDPMDYHCWVGLGESYHSSGRYVAATRALEEAERCRSQSLAAAGDGGTSQGGDNDAWFARYMLANVYRDLGEYDEAIRGYNAILQSFAASPSLPSSISPSSPEAAAAAAAAATASHYALTLALTQTHTERATHLLRQGIFGRAADGAGQAIRLARRLLTGHGGTGVAESRKEGTAKAHPTSFNAWKALGEACAVYAASGVYVAEIAEGEVLAALEAPATATDNSGRMGGSTEGDTNGVRQGQDGIDGLYAPLTDVDHIDLDLVRRLAEQLGQEKLAERETAGQNGDTDGYANGNEKDIKSMSHETKDQDTATNTSNSGDEDDISDTERPAPLPRPSTRTAAKFALYACVLSHKRAVSIAASDPHAQAVSWYNLGWACYRAHTQLVAIPARTGSLAAFTTTTTTTTSFSSTSTAAATAAEAIRTSRPLRSAVRAFKRAIELEAGNAEFWNALGIAVAPLNGRVAQHAFVRSLYLNERSAAVWANYGALALMLSDLELAREAFVRAQSADPAFAGAWAGMGVVGLLEGKRAAARQAFTQAVEIGDAAGTEAKRLYALAMFDYVAATGAGVACASNANATAVTATAAATASLFEISDLLQPLFALTQLRTQEPESLVSRHLYALFAERIGSHADGVAALAGIADDVEEEYERTESDTALTRFAHVHADWARACLAGGDFEAAVEHAGQCLDLSESDGPGDGGAGDSDDANENASARRRFRLSAHLTAGLANHWLGQADESISSFRAALTESDSDPDVVCLLAQVLWAKNTQAERDVAREQLLESVEAHPEHAQSVLLLAAIALLDADTDTLEAVVPDLHALRTRPDLDEAAFLKIARLLDAIARMHPGITTSGATNDSSLAEQAEADTSIMLAPWKPHGWAQLAGTDAATAPDDGKEGNFAAEVALLTANAAAPPKGSIVVEDLSRAHSGTCMPAGVQRAAMLAPWLPEAWTALKESTDLLA